MALVGTVFGSVDIAERADMNESKEMLELVKKHGVSEIDSAFLYADGKTEVCLGNLKDLVGGGFRYATKANPLDGKGFGAASLRHQLETSLKNLKSDQLDIFYLHLPDHKTPLAETLKAVNEMRKEGKFKEFGLSNYSSWLVAEVVNICKENGWIRPTVYQGMYSVLTRMVEKELFCCLRYHNIRFYAYSPLGGGLLTGKHSIDDLSKDEPGRFFGTGRSVRAYRHRYWKKEYFNAVEDLRTTLNQTYGKNKVSVAEAAYRWLYHHSALEGDKGDAVIVGSSSAKQLEENLAYTKKGPLEKNVVDVIDAIWKTTSHLCTDYAL